MTEYAALVEGEPARRCEIGCDARARTNHVVKAHKRGIALCQRLHRVRKGVAQPFHDLEERKIDMGDVVADHVCTARRVLLQDALKIAEELRKPALEKFGRPRLGLFLLLLVIFEVAIG